MTRSASPAEVFRRLVTGVAQGRWDELPDLYAEATHVEHPFDPLRAPALHTREDLRHHFARVQRAWPPRRVEAADIVIHETSDPEVIVAEYTYRGTIVATGAPIAVPSIFVLRVRDGRIVESRDYIDHLAGARSRGAFDDLVAAIKERDAAADNASATSRS
jgi:ketosteroid isomerase-like protein